MGNPTRDEISNAKAGHLGLDRTRSAANHAPAAPREQANHAAYPGDPLSRSGRGNLGVSLRSPFSSLRHTSSALSDAIERVMRRSNSHTGGGGGGEGEGEGEGEGIYAADDPSQLAGGETTGVMGVTELKLKVCNTRLPSPAALPHSILLFSRALLR